MEQTNYDVAHTLLDKVKAMPSAGEGQCFHLTEKRRVKIEIQQFELPQRMSAGKVKDVRKRLGISVTFPANTIEKTSRGMNRNE